MPKNNKKIEHLSDPILLMIFQYLSLRDLGRVVQVSHRFHALAEDHALWNPRLKNRYKEIRLGAAKSKFFQKPSAREPILPIELHKVGIQVAWLLNHNQTENEVFYYYDWKNTTLRFKPRNAYTVDSACRLEVVGLRGKSSRYLKLTHTNYYRSDQYMEHNPEILDKIKKILGHPTLLDKTIEHSVRLTGQSEIRRVVDSELDLDAYELKFNEKKHALRFSIDNLTKVLKYNNCKKPSTNNLQEELEWLSNNTDELPSSLKKECVELMQYTVLSLYPDPASLSRREYEQKLEMFLIPSDRTMLTPG